MPGMRALAAVGAAAAFALALAHADRTTPAAVERHAAGRAASARLGAVDGWQLHATHADEVPGSVLRAAAAVKIAVIDTGADLSVPGLAARSP
jgi:hypothetical protein